VASAAALVAVTSLRAQVRPVPDSVRKALADSIARADSVTGTLPQAELPMLTEVGMTHRWNRDSLFSSGAQTLADFLDRVPGLTTLRANFFMAPQVGAYNGDVSRVRLFLDGVELEPLDSRSGGVPDLTVFPVASLEELVVERGANELRLHMRSWRGPLRTTAQTRSDIYTGDNRSNTFRGFFAKRAHNGFAVQAMLQQRSMDDRRLGGDGDQTTVFTRVGVVKPKWSLDATLVRVRYAQQSLSLFPNALFEGVGRAIPRFDQVQRDAYLRLGLGNTSKGTWVQVVAASRQNKENSPTISADATRGFAADTGSLADTTRSSTQYVATVGWTSSRAQFSVTERLRLGGNRTLHQPSARVGIDLGKLTFAGYAERNPFDEVTRGDAFVRLQPTARIAITAAASYGSTGSLELPKDSTDVTEITLLPVARAVRGEVAVRIGRLWLQGGAVVRDSAVLRGPRLFNRGLPVVVDGRAVGLTYSVTGPIFRGFSIQANGVRWSDRDWYRPQVEARTELTWRYHFPGATKTGGFDFELTGLAEYRSRMGFPELQANGDVIELVTYVAPPLGIRAEFTIKDATLSFQLRNVLGAQYSTVPGLLMPRALTTYGVRWTFWN
jgi:hypothetical protein